MCCPDALTLLTLAAKIKRGRITSVAPRVGYGKGNMQERTLFRQDLYDKMHLPGIFIAKNATIHRVQKRKLEEYYVGSSKSVTVGVGIGTGLDLDPGPTLDILNLFRKISNGPSLDLDFDSSP